MTQDFEEHGLYFQFWEEPMPMAGSTQHPAAEF